jgi:(E)-4-hydroxy-3-methylbut-2-enyl-diphosphate synthase
MTVEAYRLASEAFTYPLHLGVTEAGTSFMGTVQSAVGIGTLLMEGIGDTIRVSLTADPVEEIYAAKEILRACGLSGGVNLISCPTCGRTEGDLIRYAEELQSKIDTLTVPAGKKLNVALMGCVVNGPGEAREADVGVAGGKGEAVLFRKGEIIGKIKEEEIVPVLWEEINRLLQ